MNRINLAIIDPQNSFCKVVDANNQQTEHDGELCVAGGWQDMLNIADMINRLGKRINNIKVTLDSHQIWHVAHPTWFVSKENNSNPAPFTSMREENGKIIGSAMDAFGKFVDVGEFTTTIRSVFSRTLNYLKELKKNNRYPHVIWPPHCLIGTTGHNIVAPLYNALLNWEVISRQTVGYVTKGSNPFVEHFSAVKAEVSDPNDPSTQINTEFIKDVSEADVILLAGEALSHCLANTVRDMADTFADDSFIKKCVLLTDGTSNVTGFDAYGTKFIDEMSARGMKKTTTKEFLA